MNINLEKTIDKVFEYNFNKLAKEIWSKRKYFIELINYNIDKQKSDVFSKDGILFILKK